MSRGRRAVSPPPIRTLPPLVLTLGIGGLMFFIVWAAQYDVANGMAALLGGMGLLACGIQVGIRCDRRRVADQRDATSTQPIQLRPGRNRR